MANNTSQVPPVLTCWKDIAQYLGKGVRTVQRWEQEFGLPVRRPNGIEHKSPVAANPRDLDAWLQTRWAARGQRKQAPGGAPQIPAIPLSETIRMAQELRSQHHALITETRSALQALHATVANCAARRGEQETQ
jgi:hypothetical protein